MIVFECRDRHAIVHFVNRAFSRRTGFAAQDLCGSNWWALHACRSNENSLSRLRDSMRCGRDLEIELRCRCKDGSWFWGHMQMTPLVDDRRTPQFHVGVLRDISAERDQLDALARDAYHDALTGLPNRRLLVDRFERAAAHTRRSAQQLALALIDLNGFKEVNDTLGHSAGDELLQLVGTSLAQAIRAEDTVARLGGDEFAVLIHSSQSYESVPAVAARIRAAIGRPGNIQGHQLRISCSIGIGLYPTDGVDFEALLEYADRRMYAQKRRQANQSDRVSEGRSARDLAHSPVGALSPHGYEESGA
jgi:diguanylate cyclase (GGDEF)-like protein/PAS domain S-box-containing protein